MIEEGTVGPPWLFDLGYFRSICTQLAAHEVSWSLPASLECERLLLNQLLFPLPLDTHTHITHSAMVTWPALCPAMGLHRPTDSWVIKDPSTLTGFRSQRMEPALGASTTSNSKLCSPPPPSKTRRQMSLLATNLEDSLTFCALGSCCSASPRNSLTAPASPSPVLLKLFRDNTQEHPSASSQWSPAVWGSPCDQGWLSSCLLACLYNPLPGT